MFTYIRICVEERCSPEKDFTGKWLRRRKFSKLAPCMGVIVVAVFEELLDSTKGKKTARRSSIFGGRLGNESIMKDNFEKYTMVG